MLHKFRFYERYGVEEYYIYDPDSGDLEGWQRQDKGLEEIAQMNGYVSRRLGIRFEPGEGPNNLTIIGSDGERFATHQELKERTQAAQERAQAAQELAERLAARLRELGIESEWNPHQSS